MTTQPYIGFLIAACRRRIKQVVNVRANPHGLTSQQFWVVMAIAEEPGISVGEVAYQRRMDDPTASRLVGTLLERRLVRITPDPDDRRRLKLGLTAAGTRLARSLAPIARDVRRDVVRGFSRGEEATLRRLLLKVMANADAMEGPALERPRTRR